ncbi:MAG: glycerophosphodiester phosphodiesterase [Leptolinea sp.]|jgi:glycerophosphoryl diester phosphodiesterase|nr:glycerophosphodiester phosphodiesterase [Leptolinea sp.]
MLIRPRILNIAHRGARSLAPENTLAAARKALECGADLWECDVALTSDGVPVILHDESLRRTSNASSVYPNRKPWKLQTFTFEELQKLDFGSWFLSTDPFKQIKNGVLQPDELKAFVGEPILTLREALQFTKENHWQINVEIKDLRGIPGANSIVEAVVGMIKEMRMEDQVWLSSFNHQYITRIKEISPEIKTGALVEWLDLNPLAHLQQTKAQSYNPGIRLANPRVIRSIREQGFDVFVWTVNKETSMRKLIKAGVSGIFTDFPHVLRDVLDSYAR